MNLPTTRREKQSTDLDNSATAAGRRRRKLPQAGRASLLAGVLLSVGFTTASGRTVALWLFDEPAGTYPSTILNDAAGNRNALVLGRGGRICPGRFGNALESADPLPLEMSGRLVALGKLQGAIDAQAQTDPLQFGLVPLPRAPGRTVEPMTWMNARFAAMFTRGERHLRSGHFNNATETKLNLGERAWTVEFWFTPVAERKQAGVIFEIGCGPRGENDLVTSLTVDPTAGAFRLLNQPSQTDLLVSSDPRALGSGWHHYAFVHDGRGKLWHFIDGKLFAPPLSCHLQALPYGDESYFSVARDGHWNRPLPGKLDELRISDEALYRDAFSVPQSFSTAYSGRFAATKWKAGPPLLFGNDARPPFALGTRKHLFLDEALVEEAKNVDFRANPPRRMERVIDGPVKGHLSVVEDGDGLLRLYCQGPDDSLAVMTSCDGVHWRVPDLGREFHGQRNIVCEEQVGLGTVFIDPTAPPGQRWKYVSGIRRQGIFVFTSPDGWRFSPHETAALPITSGSQSAIYYDDQRQLFVAHHRSGYDATATGATQRRYVRSEVSELLRPWPFVPSTAERTRAYGRDRRTHAELLDPWFLDNGPLAPAACSVELPTAFAADPQIDPPETDVYVTKAIKYPWAPDAYLAFPTMYFHYWETGDPAREALGMRAAGRGSGVTEVQLATSRDGLTWKRYPRPEYVPIGGLGRNDVHMLFLTQGLVRRGDELWQFVGGHGGNGIGYHSAWTKGAGSPVWRLVQRLDGFACAEGAYEGGVLKTKPLTFAGHELRLNIDTGAVGFAQVGITGADGHFLPGYGLEDCVYINGDFLSAPVEWLDKRTDVSPLAGQVVQLVFRLRGARLFAMQFE